MGGCVLNESHQMNISSTAYPDKGNAGFSLIELSILLIVMGLLITPLINAYSVYQAQKRMNDTSLAVAMVNNAISNYYGMSLHYPCRIAILSAVHIGGADISYDVEFMLRRRRSNTYFPLVYVMDVFLIRIRPDIRLVP